MLAELIPHEEIPKLAAKIDSPAMLRILRRIQRAGFILNGHDVDSETADLLRRLMQLGLVDAGYEGTADSKLYLWCSNGNGSRVLRYLASIPAGPHYEIPSSELAAWLEEQGKDRWWNVDGDSLLTGRLTFPCPAGELVAELRRIDRPLLVQAKKNDTGAQGQRIGKDKLNDLVGHFAENMKNFGTDDMPLWGADRLLYLCWKGSIDEWRRKGSFDEWLLAEDSETAEQMRADEIIRANEVSKTRRE